MVLQKLGLFEEGRTKCSQALDIAESMTGTRPSKHQGDQAVAGNILEYPSFESSCCVGVSVLNVSSMRSSFHRFEVSLGFSFIC